jgi:hypothetical protein
MGWSVQEELQAVGQRRVFRDRASRGDAFSGANRAICRAYPRKKTRGTTFLILLKTTAYYAKRHRAALARWANSGRCIELESLDAQVQIDSSFFAVFRGNHSPINLEPHTLGCFGTINLGHATAVPKEIRSSG